MRCLHILAHYFLIQGFLSDGMDILDYLMTRPNVMPRLNPRILAAGQHQLDLSLHTGQVRGHDLATDKFRLQQTHSLEMTWMGFFVFFFYSSLEPCCWTGCCHLWTGVSEKGLVKDATRFASLSPSEMSSAVSGGMTYLTKKGKAILHILLHLQIISLAPTNALMLGLTRKYCQFVLIFWGFESHKFCKWMKFTEWKPSWIECYCSTII